MTFILHHLSHYTHIYIFITILIWITKNAWQRFILPSKTLVSDLSQAITNLKKIKGRSVEQITNLDDIKLEVMKSEILTHLWSEYQETLHPQKQVDNYGHEKIIRWRSTAMAEMFFTEQVLVDSPLKTEYYKHLPGILTGIGIIGTFSGLILGLMKFEVDGPPAIVRASLGNLIQGVGHSFLVSAAAIILAMIFTYIEKSTITNCYRLVEEFCQVIDSFFDAGAGEEYLERLVIAAESSATQSSQIKDALVADLKQILTDLNTQQVEASASHNRDLSRNISESFAEVLREPMDRISQAVTNVGSSQGEAVNQLLTDVLASFTAQMNETFGSQFQGMNEMMHHSTLAMQTTISRFDQLAANMQTAGQGAADAMADKLSDAISSMDARQSAASQQMSVFLEQMRTVSKDSQTETSQKMQNILGELGEKVSAMVSQLELQADKAAGSHESHLAQLSGNMIDSMNMMKSLMKESQVETLNMSKQTNEDQSRRQEEFSSQANSLITDLSNQVGTLSDRVGNAAEAMRTSIASLTQASRDSMDRFSAGAETLYVASSDFAKAGQGVATTMQSAAQATDKMQSVAVLLSGAAASVQNVMDDYKKTRETFAAIVADLESTISNAKREASFTTEIISQIRQATELLTAAQSETEDYLKSVTDVLAQAHTDFAGNVTKTLRKGNAEFQQELSTAVGLLKSGIQDFGDALDSFQTKRS